MAECQVRGDILSLAQSSTREVVGHWVDFPPAVFGSASDADFAAAGDEGLRRAFIRYLDTVRVKPADMHVHYNDWWTAPMPSSGKFVFENIEKLRKGLYDRTGFFFDSYALDMGWSNDHSVWRIDKGHFPDGFDTLRDLLAGMGSRPGLWVSPSSLYPPALDNQWLESEGYEVTPHRKLGLGEAQPQVSPGTNADWGQPRGASGLRLRLPARDQGALLFKEPLDGGDLH